MEIACRLCGHRGHTVVGEEVGNAPEAKVYRCGGCGVVFLHPIMTPAEEKTFYAAEFEAYMSARAGTEWNDPEEMYKTNAAETTRRKRLVDPLLRRDQTVLEIGSSNGFFLHAIRDQVAGVTGVEPSIAFRDYANSVGIETVEYLEDLKGRRFDVIIIYYVLEHMRDGGAYLREVADHLAPGGQVLLEVPNVEDALVAWYDLPEFRKFYWQKAHYYYYAPATLQALADSAGFRAVLTPEQRYDLSNHMIWMRDRRPGGAGRFADRFTAVLEEAYADALCRTWGCDTIFAVLTRRADAGA